MDINIFNLYDDHKIDTTYMGNREAFDMLDSYIRDTAIVNHTQIISVISSSSIEGRESYNNALSRRRMRAIESVFRQRYDHISADKWDFSYTAENWVYLRKAVFEDVDVPNKEGVISIIDMKNETLDDRENLLKKLDNGVSWGYILQHILPSSRGSVSMLFIPQRTLPIAILGANTPVSVSLPVIAPSLSVSVPTSGEPATPPTYYRPIISLRTNLLLDVTSTVNLGVEVPVAPRWSLSAEYINPWWDSWENSLTWQIESLYFDVRYWLSKRGSYNTLTGWSVGAYAGSGRYDLQPFKENGVQGEYSDFGVTLSYAHNLGQSKHWLMEYNVGLGYVTTHYRHYYSVADTQEYGNIKVHNYPWSEETLKLPLPTRLGVTLCYLINVASSKRGDVR